MPESVRAFQARLPKDSETSDAAGFELPAVRYRLTFRAQTQVRLPAFAGSAWRGAFGHALKRTACVTREPRCPDCLLYRSCLYPYVFETPPPPDAAKMRRYPAAPHPFVLEPDFPGPQQLEAGDPLCLGLVLLGRANDQLAYFVHALGQAGAGGLGGGRGRLALERVEGERADGSWVPVHAPGEALETLPAKFPAPPPCPPEVVLELETPLRLQQDGCPAGPADLRFPALFGALVRRVSMLTYFHTDTPFETDFRALVDAARDQKVGSQDLRWQDWTRYSSRQGRPVRMGGLLGSLVLEGPGLEPLWPFLWLGQWAHVGKGTVMGLGRYRLGRDRLGRKLAGPTMPA